MSATAKVIEHEPTATAVATRQETPVALSPMDMLSRAVTSGAGIEVVERLMALAERWEAGRARKAFDEAMAAAKAEIPVITKNRHVGFDSKKPGASRTDYRHEDMAEIARTVDPILSRYGLSYRFRTTSAINEPVTVTCILSHRDGHSEQNTLMAGRDESGNKNSIQSIGSTLTYLQRYTLKAALGLAASTDDDGKAADTGNVVSDAQADAITKLAIEVSADVPKFLAYMKAESISDIPAGQYQRAIDALNAKRRAKQ